jgi:predicted transglutaminase-like cysteine proteinase
LAFLALFAAGLAPARAAAGVDAVFGAKERAIPGVVLLKKWVRVLDQTLKADAARSSCGGNAGKPSCHLADWRKTRDAAAEIEDRKEQMLFVNKRLNEQPYIIDMTNWGVSDYWEIPAEFKRVSGDCEDYAISKFLMLRNLGWPEESLRIVIVHDSNLDIGHAILLVKLDDTDWVLDNQTKTPLPMERVLHYVPFYSFNTEMTWLHRF